MKIIRKILLLSFVILILVTTKVLATKATVSSTALRVREKPSTDSEIITNVYKGDIIEIVEDSGEWVKIKYNKDEGYVKKEFLNIDEKEKQSEETDDSKNKETDNKLDNNDKVSVYNNENTDNTEVILNENTYLKLLPNFMSKNIEMLNVGAKLKIVSELNNWIQVTDGTVYGWILKSKTNKQVASTKIETSDIENSKETNKESNNIVNENIVVNNIVANNTVTNNENKIENSIVETENKNTTNANNENKTETTSFALDKKGKITVETGRVRKSASSTSEIIDCLNYGDVVEIEGVEGDWYKVKYNNTSGYVNKKIMTEISNITSSRSLTEERKNENKSTENSESDLESNSEKLEENKDTISNLNNGAGASVVQYAKNYLGYPYVVAGKNPTSGFDCSGFTKYVFSNFGVNLASVASDQANAGTEILRENLSEGDLILFYDKDKTKIGHVGIYIGNGEFIHSANPARGVVIDNLNTNTYYNERYVSARRIVN